MSDDTSTFDLAGTLPSGRSAIEASAGTGKTFTLSTLVARYVTELDIPIGEILVVTFTRAAAAELRDRVRGRLLEFEQALGSLTAPDDPVLAGVWATDRELRRHRARAAISEFDGAMITTIHGFSQQVLGTLGSAVATNPQAVLSSDALPLIERIATDVLVATALRGNIPTDQMPALNDITTVVGVLLNNRGAAILPEPVDLDGSPDAANLDALADADRHALIRRGVVDEILANLESARRQSATLSFDDLLVELRNALRGDGGAVACDALRQRFRVALIDEFQDTDPVQWEIFDTLFDEAAFDTDPHRSLVVVGDPKQAIYDFRGANVHTYLDAAHAEGATLSGLTRNWRSDTRSLAATEALLSGATFGDPRIEFHSVQAAPDNTVGIQHADGTPQPALSIRVATGSGIDRQKTNATLVMASSAEEAIYRDVAAHIRDTLEHSWIPSRTTGEMRRVQPDDIAVLISANYQGPSVRRALTHLDIPAVITRGDSVLDAPAADHWHRLLEAVTRPSDARRARGAALTWFFGWNGTDIATATDAQLVEVQEQLSSWGEALASRGVASFISQVWRESHVVERVLQLRDGDRAMTDLDHISELLARSTDGRVSSAGLLGNFNSLAATASGGDPDNDLLARRVETDARSVQIMTTFVAKGLEFPVVCCPMLWKGGSRNDPHRSWWDNEAETRVIDVAAKLSWGSAAEQDRRKQQAADEAFGTAMRVLYVALTRARHHSAVWWAPGQNVWSGPLAKVLFARAEDGTLDLSQFDSSKLPHVVDDEVFERLAPVVDAAGGAIEVREIGRPTSSQAWSPAETESSPELEFAEFTRLLDRSATRWSFSAITARADDHHDYVDPLDEHAGDGGANDEGIEGVVDGPVPPDAEVDTDDGPRLTLGPIPGGAGFGTLVHEVLERVDFTATDLDAHLLEHVVARLQRNPWPVDVDALVRGLRSVIETPLGPLFGGFSLADLRMADRLDELSFDFTLGEGPHRATDADLGQLVVDHLESTDPLRPWAESLATGLFSSELAGHLTGSIDLVARVRDASGVERFVVSDYKTNRIAASGVDAHHSHFEYPELLAAMTEHHYPLQALLYSAALHRYLRWRLADYDPGTHLGGIGYLFVRGMVGPDTPTTDGRPNGLFEWHPPTALITDLSDLLDGHLQPGTAAR